MEKLEQIFNPEINDEQLILKIEELKEKFPNIGVVCNGMKPIERKIEVCNTAKPSAMQFRPKNLEEMQKLVSGVKENARKTSIHLADPKFNEETGEIDVEQKEEIIKILKQETGNNFNLMTIHPGWKQADLVLDKEGNWKETELAKKVIDDLADLFIPGIQSGKIMTFENIGHEEESREMLGNRPEHLMAMRDKISQAIAVKLDLPVNKVLEKIGYTFDAGHVVKNTRLLEQCSVETWLEKLGKDIKLMHIHDVLPPEELPDNMLPEGDKNRYKREHKSLGRGSIDWKSFFQLKNQHCPDAPMILELNNDGTGENTIKSIDYLNKL